MQDPFPQSRGDADESAEVSAHPPADVTSFLGRRGDVANLKRVLGESRLVTLTGVGGVGKTRLAVRVTRDLARQFPDGVAWIELADLRDGSMLAQTIQNRLAIPEKVGRGAEAVLAHHVRQRRMLLVLDNCEHILGACQSLVDALLRSGPELRILATSRQALGLPSESLVPVSPLRVPAEDEGSLPGSASQIPSMALFQERAASVVPGFRITPDNQANVAEVCRKVEGIPLAIELAAVKVRVLSVAELAVRLDKRLKMLRRSGQGGPNRHQTIEATIDWSHELCTREERTLWARVSVFAGGFGAEAAEEVCSREDDLPVESVLDALAGLVDKSILQRNMVDGRLRFHLLEPLREHGQTQLRDSGEELEFRERHLAWCADLVSEACMQWFGPTQRSWCVTLRQELPNIRAAAEFCLADPQRHETALVLLGDPWFLWVALYLDEGRLWLERVLAVAVEPTLPRAKALATAGYVAALQGDRAAAEEFLDESRHLATEFEPAEVLAYASHARGLTALFYDPEIAVDRLTEALGLYASADVYDDYPSGLQVQLGLAHLFLGNAEAAEEQFEACRSLAEVTGEEWLHSYALYGLGFVARMRGDAAQAVSLTRRAIEIKAFFKDLLGLAVSVDLLAWNAADAGDAQDAATLLGASSRIWDRFGPRLFGSDHWLAQHRAAVESARQALGARAYAAAVEVGEQLSLDEAIACALGRPDVVPRPRTSTGDVKLTPRETQIADLVADGLSNREIAERLVIAQRTAEGHVENILTKLDFHSRSQIAAWVGESRAGSEGVPHLSHH